MAEPLRWGIVGAGGIARRQVMPAVRDHPDVRLQAVCVRETERAQALAAEFGAAAGYGSFEALLDDPLVEAVYLATPVALHAAQARRALESGRDVLIEKPMTLTVIEADELLAVAAAASRRLAVCLPMRLSAGVTALRAGLAAGRVGELTYLRAQLAKWYPLEPGAWRADPAQAGGGALMDLGSHLLDAVGDLGGPPTSVCATLASAPGAGVEHTALVQATLAGGALASLEVSFAAADSEQSFEVYGSTGAALVRGGRVRWLGDAPDEEPLAAVQVHGAGFAQVSRAFRDGTPVYADGVAGRRNVACLAACYESARHGRRVDVGAGP